MVTPQRIIELWDTPPYGLVTDDRFHLLTGDQAHEVAVGPVHAGVIEPGHFRFQCLGEDVHNLEISLGYQHRGVEKLIVEAKSDARRLALAQTVAGDTSFAATLACTAALGLMPAVKGQPEEDRHPSNLQPSTFNLQPSTCDLLLLLELERIANHVGDLGALAGDVAYLPTASFCGRIRGEYLNMTAHLTGNRFGRLLTTPPLCNQAVRQSNNQTISNQTILPPETAKTLLPWFLRTKLECFHALDLLFSESSAIERFEGTGVVSEADARSIGMVGVAARASGVTDTMGGWPVVGGGDVLARARQRYEELKVSHRIVERILAEGAGTAVIPLTADTDILKGQDRLKVYEVETEDSFYRIAVVDAWRGELIHAARYPLTPNPQPLTPDTQPLNSYRIFDPSYFNWFGLSLALRGEQISNFPICNKSFNLSYCGVDR